MLVDVAQRLRRAHEADRGQERDPLGEAGRHRLGHEALERTELEADLELQELRAGTHLLLGAVENPQAPPQGYRVDRALKKVRAGAQFLQLQVGFELGPLEQFMREAVATGLAEKVAILPSICLVRSPSALRFIDQRVPGISVPADVIDRCERAADPEAECFEVACELADAARALPGVRGLHLISFRKEAGIARLCARLGIPTRHERETIGNGSRIAV